MRPGAANHASRYLDRESASRLNVRGGNLGTAGVFGRGLSFHPRGMIGITDYMFNNENSLLLRGLLLYHGWVPFLLVYLVWTFGFDQRALPAWAILLGSAAGVLLLHAAPESASRADARQYQLRMGSERLCCSELGFARRLAHRIDDRIALAAVRADSFSATAHRPEAGAINCSI